MVADADAHRSEDARLHARFAAAGGAELEIPARTERAHAAKLR
jgi:hypothetical protein